MNTETAATEHASAENQPTGHTLGQVPLNLATLYSITLGVILESRWLGNHDEITQQQALDEVDELNAANTDPLSFWRLPTPHEEFVEVDYDAKNPNGALTRNPERVYDGYWTNQTVPSYPRSRFVVGFAFGNVLGYLDFLRFRARAVRVPRQ